MRKRRLNFLQWIVLLLLSVVGLALLIVMENLDLTSTPARSPGTTDNRPTTFNFPVTWATVDGVLDGDTIRLSDGKRVRYIGIDTPETESNPPECFSAEAKARNREWVDGQRIALRKDRSEVDRYGRLLRYVYLEDGRMINELLVQEGYAIAAEFPPDTRFAERFAELQARAQRAARGLWGVCEN